MLLKFRLTVRRDADRRLRAFARRSSAGGGEVSVGACGRVCTCTEGKWRWARVWGSSVYWSNDGPWVWWRGGQEVFRRRDAPRRSATRKMLRYFGARRRGRWTAPSARGCTDGPRCSNSAGRRYPGREQWPHCYLRCWTTFSCFLNSFVRKRSRARFFRRDRPRK